MVSAQNTNFYHLVWNKTNLKDVIAENLTKTKLECVDVVADKLKKVQYGLSDLTMRDKATTSANGNSYCEWAQLQQAPTFDGFLGDLRKGLQVKQSTRHDSQYFTGPEGNTAMFTDWCYGRAEGPPNSQARESRGLRRTPTQMFCLSTIGMLAYESFRTRPAQGEGEMVEFQEVVRGIDRPTLQLRSFKPMKVHKKPRATKMMMMVGNTHMMP
ncbi:hypothetical protein E4U14_006234 [Claviceps sp. LM454 group G7]|nr:hypothetical protein E4U14_006234 [Claviceps sp. LM454 group G7]